ncbi:MAG: caspase family protein [Bacteroidota bacterium]
MKKLLLFFCFIGLFVTNTNAQNGFTIHIYRPNKSFTGIVKFKLFLNNKEIGMVEKGTRAECKVFSAGKYEIRLDGYSMGREEGLDCQNTFFVTTPRPYYFKIFSTNNAWKIIEVSKSLAEPEIAEINKKENILEFSEDPNDPFNPSTAFDVKKNPVVNNVVTEVTPIQQPLEPSETDKNIPLASKENPNLFALIIGNEDYKTYQTDLGSEANVDFAVNDAKVFTEYVKKTLGAPSDNVTLLTNATSAKISQELSKLTKIIEVYEGKAEIIFFYAGHGLPDENSKEPFLIPVDVSGKDLQYAIKLENIYKGLTQFPAKRVTVFLDACFSGGARNANLISARAMRINPKEQSLGGNLIVFSSSSGDESSLAFKDKQHGLFTYFLLKKIQDTKGNLTYKELADFIASEVKKKSVVKNNKVQTPQIKVSPDIQSVWEKWPVRP